MELRIRSNCTVTDCSVEESKLIAELACCILHVAEKGGVGRERAERETEMQKETSPSFTCNLGALNLPIS
jgi:hypothetical protein